MNSGSLHTKTTGSLIRITKLFNFEMAHALYGYDGACKNIHGHSYQLSVTIIGKVITTKKSPKLGMVADFSDLKKIVEELIVKPLDHALLLNKNSPHRKMFSGKSTKIVWADYQPTCENMLVDFAERIRKKLPENCSLHHLQLRETATAFAEWYAEDNK